MFASWPTPVYKRTSLLGFDTWANNMVEDGPPTPAQKDYMELSSFENRRAGTCLFYVCKSKGVRKQKPLRGARGHDNMGLYTLVLRVKRQSDENLVFT